jgi:hypothetical protein
MSSILGGLKLKVVNKCLELVEIKISHLEIERSKIQDSANNETKSSMGDKYETGRAMAQNEIGKLELNIAELKKQLSLLKKISFEDLNHIYLGTLLVLEKDVFFLSIPLGKIYIGEKTVFCISTSSPIGKMLIGKKINEEIIINGNSKKIKEVINV